MQLEIETVKCGRRTVKMRQEAGKTRMSIFDTRVKLSADLAAKKISRAAYDKQTAALQAKSNAIKEDQKKSVAARDSTKCGLQKCKAQMMGSIAAVQVPGAMECKRTRGKKVCAVAEELKALLKEGEITVDSYHRVFDKLNPFQ